MASTTLSFKVDPRFAHELRNFCKAHSLNLGKFAEHAVREFMEDFHFGTKAQRVLTQHAGKPSRHDADVASSSRLRK